MIELLLLDPGCLKIQQAPTPGLTSENLLSLQNYPPEKSIHFSPSIASNHHPNTYIIIIDAKKCIVFTLHNTRRIQLQQWFSSEP